MTRTGTCLSGPKTSVTYHPVSKEKGGIFLLGCFTSTQLNYHIVFFHLKMNCSICTALAVETSPHQFHDKQVGLISVDHLDAMDVKLIAYRIGLDEDKIQTICYHHKQTLLTKHEWLEKSYCNPFKNHKKQIKGGLKAISLDLADKAKAKLVLIPGKKTLP